jgi:hypothetical protein
LKVVGVFTVFAASEVDVRTTTDVIGKHPLMHS